MVVGLVANSNGQVIYPTPFFTFWADTTFSSTFDGSPLPLGSIIEAYDPDGVLCGLDTVILSGAYGFTPVYGDDSQTPALDEGAIEGDTISFKINGRQATVVSGDPVWSNQAQKQAALSVASSVIAITAIELPTDILAVPNSTVQFRARVRNDGDGLDFYGVNLSMSIPDDSTIFGWKALEPDSVVYAQPGQEVDVFFSIHAAVYTGDTVNTISYSIFSHLDTTVTVDGSVNIIITVTDVDEDDPSGLLPDAFTLKQNYPNPFNPSTTIEFSLPSGSDTRLEIFNTLGQTVDIVEFGFLQAGEHSVLYDASALSSGVYFYRVSTQTTAKSRKMVLIK